MRSSDIIDCIERTKLSLFCARHQNGRVNKLARHILRSSPAGVTVSEFYRSWTRKPAVSGAYTPRSPLAMVFNVDSLSAVNSPPVAPVDRFMCSLAMNSKDHGFWSVSLLFNAESHEHEEGHYFCTFYSLKNPWEPLDLYLRLFSALFPSVCSNSDVYLHMVQAPKTRPSKIKPYEKSGRI